MKVFVAGARGQVAQALVVAAAKAGVRLTALGRPGMDIGDPASVRRALERERPDVVINAAAYTDVEAAEKDSAQAQLVNADGATLLANEAGRLDLPVVHLSTDYVFGGARDGRYSETDAARPLNVYGATKLSGEYGVASVNNRHVILRTSWVYSPWSRNFLKTMLRIGRERDEVGVVDDQIGAPTSARDIADGALSIARGLAEGRADGFGLFHMTAGGEASWADFAEAIFLASGAIGGPVARVKRIPSADYPQIATRPMNSRLDCSLVRDTWGVALPDWRDSVEGCVNEILQSETAA